MSERKCPKCGRVCVGCDDAECDRVPCFECAPEADTGLDSVIAAHEATNAKLLLRIAELEAENKNLLAGFPEYADPNTKAEREQLRARITESDRYIEHAVEVVSAATFEVEVSVIDGIKSLAGKRDALAKENASLRERVARLSAPAVGLAESGPYTLADVALIEANRGRPYGRLRETVVERDSLREQVATLQQTRVIEERETKAMVDAAKADAARLREALGLALKNMVYTDVAAALSDVHNDTLDSAAWLESKIAERTALHVEREKSLEQQLVAATNDAARAELRARDLATALSKLIPDKHKIGRGVEKGSACGHNYLAINGVVVAMEGDVCREVGYGEHWTGDDFDKIESTFKAPIVAALATSPDSDERLREVMNEVALRAYRYALLHGRNSVDSEISRIVDEILGVKS